MSESEVQLFPRWRQALQDFLQGDFKPGDVVSLAWFEEAFGMDVLAPDAMVMAAEMKQRQFEWLSSIEALKGELLEGHQILLLSVRGEGYRWVPPHEQTGVTTEKFERDASRVYRQAGQRLRNVRVAELTDAQRRENLDAVTRLAMLRGMQKAAIE